MVIRDAEHLLAIVDVPVDAEPGLEVIKAKHQVKAGQSIAFLQGDVCPHTHTPHAPQTPHPLKYDPNHKRYISNFI